MTLRVFKRPQAINDIEECFVYIAKDNIEIGMDFLSAVESSLQQLVKFPHLGKSRKFQHKLFREVRMLRVKGFEHYLIFYRVAENTIEVIRILQGSRDIDNLFS
ncbi:MAG: type II toxin-antitoxin system RelE/ParE family toxin [Pyrinomonadaceae bacterium]